jgi:glucuronoarabinoxylan endo-1,4-beta-xylanase
LAAVIALSLPCHAGVTVVQGSSPGATSWPGSPTITTMANPSSANVAETFTNGNTLNTNLSQTFTITTTNYVLQTIDIYAGGGTGTGTGTNLTLNLYDLGNQVWPNPSPYYRQAYQDVLGPNLLGAGAGLAITYTNQSNGILEFDFSGADQVYLQLGHTYVFELGGVTNTRPLYWFCVTSGSYSGGAAYTNEYWLNGVKNYSADFSMAVYANVTTSPPSVPSPLTGTVTVDWNTVYQRIDGFGASSAFAGGGFSTAQYDMLFSTNTGIGLSLCRNQVQATVPPVATAAEISIMQAAQARGARLWSTPWSPYQTFKVPQVTDGGMYAGLGGNATNVVYAQQLASYLVSMKSQNLPIYALSIQNEPDVTNAGYACCGWIGQQFHDFATNLYNAMVASNVADTKIMLPESENWASTNATNFYLPTMTDPSTATNVSIIADHNYDGIYPDPATDIPIQLASYGKTVWETEVAILYPGGSSDSGMQNGMYWAQRLHAFLTVAQASAYHYWWLMYGNSTANQGLTDISTSVLAKRAYVIGQYSRFVRPNYYRLGVTTNSGTVMVSAYKDTNANVFAIVAINSNYTNSVNQTFNLTNFFTTGSVTPWITSPTLSLASQSPAAVSGSSFAYTLPAMSVVTFVGQAATNPAPTMAAVPNQVINAGVTLLITNPATDLNVPPLQLAFSLLSGPTNASLSSLDATDALLTWRPLVSQANTTNLITVTAAVSPPPSMSATNSFTVTVNPLTNPVVGSATVSGGQVKLTVNGPQGPDYTLLTTTNLTGGWQVLYTTNSPMTPLTLVDTNSANPARFYRIQLGP